MTTQEQLNELNTAITEILTGAQEYYYNSRRVRKADIQFLLAERQRLERKLQGESYPVTACTKFARR